MLAHWKEFLDDPEYKIYRPRQIYVGHDVRPYPNLTERKNTVSYPIQNKPIAISVSAPSTTTSLTNTIVKSVPGVKQRRGEKDLPITHAHPHSLNSSTTDAIPSSTEDHLTGIIKHIQELLDDLLVELDMDEQQNITENDKEKEELSSSSSLSSKTGFIAKGLKEAKMKLTEKFSKFKTVEDDDNGNRSSQ